MADGIKIGNLDISAFKVGQSDCQIYLGSTLLYPSHYKLIAQYMNSTINRVGCNSNTTLTQSEVTGYTTSKMLMSSADIGDCTTEIGSLAFYQCKGLQNITISSGVTSIGSEAFYQCEGLQNITIPDSVTNIGEGVFNQCKLTNVTIGNGSVNIGRLAFGNNTRLKNVTIGSGCTSIDRTAFYGCTDIVSFTIKATTPPTIGSTGLDQAVISHIYVPRSAVNTYKTTTGWSNHASIISAIPGS